MRDSEIKKRNIKVDPDPISIALAVLGAIGSVASIASYIEGRKHQRGSIHKFVDPTGTFWPSKSISIKTKFRDRLTKLDASLEDIKGRMETLESLLIDVDYIREVPLSELPFEFGAVQPLLESQELSIFFRIQNEINHLSTKITKECQGLIKLLSDTDLQVSPIIYAKTLQLRTSLNKAMRENLRFKEVISLNISSIVTALAICELLREEIEAYYE